ncbi:MAG: MBOAT family protein, partial [Ignavibacteriae bacterium]|nr:MBOAT family protein [Ignavibacteriota bacterium]
MVFSSLSFVLFFTVFFLLYWFVFNKSLRLQNLLLLVGSYIFYAWADWRLLSFLVAASALNYILGIYIEKTSNPVRRKVLLYIGIIESVGSLVYFKYFNFFIDSFNDLFNILQFKLSLQTLHIILPLGISFFSFKLLSYILDVDKGKIEATKNWLVFFSYVAFFPTLLSGPIDKARTFVPQLQKIRVFEYNKAVDGLRQILWGLFKKVVIADNCAEYANVIFNNSSDYSGSTLVLGALFFTFQIYGDFSGYSDIAIGTARLFGMDLLRNFAFPYFSRDIAEFWRRWHISLSTWFRDYLYIPLGGSKGGNWMRIRNTFIIFVVSGFWHGANWTF